MTALQWLTECKPSSSPVIIQSYGKVFRNGVSQDAAVCAMSTARNSTFCFVFILFCFVLQKSGIPGSVLILYLFPNRRELA